MRNPPVRPGQLWAYSASGFTSDLSFGDVCCVCLVIGTYIDDDGDRYVITYDCYLGGNYAAGFDENEHIDTFKETKYYRLLEEAP